MAEFNRAWSSSVKPRKQRKYLAKAPLHIKHKLLSAQLSKGLRQKYKKRSFPVRKGDKVKITVGKFKGVIGEIEKVSLKKSRIYIKGAELKKREGAPAITYPIHPSNVQIITLNLDDKRRIKALERKS